MQGTMQDRFTSREVIALTGITARQLQWWDERSVVKPEREGHRRLYSLDRLTEVAVICELRRKGFSLQGVRKVMRFLDREFGKGLAEIVDRNSEYHLLTDGKRLQMPARNPAPAEYAPSALSGNKRHSIRRSTRRCQA